MFSGLAGWVIGGINSLGYIGIGGLIAVENLFPPIPSELILPLAGFLTGRGQLAFTAVVIAATAGSVIGALILYALGYALGLARVRGFVARYGRWAFLSETDVDHADQWFYRHGDKAVLIGRLVPVVRSLVSIPAGVCHMRLGRFIVYTAIGSGIWNSLLIGLGRMLGKRWELVREYSQFFEYGVVAVLIAAVVWYIWHRRAQ